MSQQIALADLQMMLRMAAKLVDSNPVYLPLFQRIERELAAFQENDCALARARALAAHQRTAA